MTLPLQTSHWRIGLAALFFACVLGLSLARIVQQRDVPGEPGRGGAALTDFRDTFYYPGVALLDGHNPYASIGYLNRYPVAAAFPLYSPASLLLHLPLSLLPYRLAQGAHLLLNISLVLALTWLTFRFFERAPSAAPLLTVAGLILLARPGQWSLFLGQCTFYIVGGVYLALLYARTRPALAGIGLALATIKPTFGLPLAFLMLCRGDHRAVMPGAAIAAATALIGLVPVLYVAGGWESFVDSLHENLIIFRRNPDVDALSSPYRADLVALLGRAFNRSLSLSESVLVSAAVLSVSGAVIRKQSRQPRSQTLTACLICISLSVIFYHLQYDTLLLAAPLLALTVAPSVLEPMAGGRVFRFLSLALLAVPAANYLATRTTIDSLGLSGAAWEVATSATSLATGLLFLLWVAAGVRSRGTDSRALAIQRSRLKILPISPARRSLYFQEAAPPKEGKVRLFCPANRRKVSQE